MSTRTHGQPNVTKQLERPFNNKDTLLELAKSSTVEVITVIVLDVERNVLHQNEKDGYDSKSGRCYGVSVVQTTRRQTPLPVCATGNVRSIRSQTDELSALCMCNYA